MALMVYFVIFSLFFLRLVTLNEDSASESTLEAEDQSKVNLLKVLLKVYMLLNLGEYLHTILFLSLSIFKYTKMH